MRVYELLDSPSQDLDTDYLLIFKLKIFIRYGQQSFMTERQT